MENPRTRKPLAHRCGGGGAVALSDGVGMNDGHNGSRNHQNGILDREKDKQKGQTVWISREGEEEESDE